jgi:hypothetical protein
MTTLYLANATLWLANITFFLAKGAYHERKKGALV